MRNARTVIAGVLCALMICCMLGNAYTVKGKEMLLAPENKETKDQNTENSKIEDNNTENEEELNKGAKKEDTSMQIGAPSALLMEASTGTVLFEQDADTKRPPASVTKIMTMLLIFDAVESKKISLEDKVPVSEFAASMGGSQVFLETGETQTVDTMLKCISIASANDACVAMAEYISGSEEAFVQEMNKRAKALGMHNTNFVNCNGLDALLEALGQGRGVQNGQVRLRCGAHVLQSVQEAVAVLGDHAAAVHADAAHFQGGPHGVAGEQLVVAGDAGKLDHAELHDHVVDELLCLTFGQDALVQIALDINVKEGGDAAHAHGGAVLGLDGGQIAEVQPLAGLLGVLCGLGDALPIFFSFTSPPMSRRLLRRLRRHRNKGKIEALPHPRPPGNRKTFQHSCIHRSRNTASQSPW